MNFEQAQSIADAVLFEGYLLYPYRASSRKNQMRWQFGIVAPCDYRDKGGSDPCRMQTECLLQAGRDSRLDVRIRFLQIQDRRVEEAIDDAGDVFHRVAKLPTEDTHYVSWQEGVEQCLDYPSLSLAELLSAESSSPFEIASSRESTLIQDSDGVLRGRIIRERKSVSGMVRLRAESSGQFLKLHASIDNLSAWPSSTIDRDRALLRSLVGVHTFLKVSRGKFLSLTDPPSDAVSAANQCQNLHTWPVLVGDRDRRNQILSSPIILEDFPRVASESPGDWFDATEIDEMLALRILTLTEEEKREARATDPRAREIIERAESFSPQMLARLHGRLRSRRTAEEMEESEGASRKEAHDRTST